MKKRHAKLHVVTPDNVAGKAKPRHSNATKKEKKLYRRIADYEKMDLSKSPAGSYHKPGSLAK